MCSRVIRPCDRVWQIARRFAWTILRPTRYFDDHFLNKFCFMLGERQEHPRLRVVVHTRWIPGFISTTPGNHYAEIRPGIRLVCPTTCQSRVVLAIKFTLKDVVVWSYNRELHLLHDLADQRQSISHINQHKIACILTICRGRANWMKLFRIVVWPYSRNRL